jgi:hypothetical protein
MKQTSQKQQNGSKYYIPFNTSTAKKAGLGVGGREKILYNTDITQKTYPEEIKKTTTHTQKKKNSHK